MVASPYSAVGGCTTTSLGTPTTFATAAAKSPFPKALVCGAHGQLSPSKASAAVITSYTAASCQATSAPVFFAPVSFAPNDPFAFCRDQCVVKGQPDCISFQYNSATDTCTLFKRSLAGMGLSKPDLPRNQAKVHYHRNCFATKTTSTTPTSTSYNWCAETPSITVTLTDPSLSYPGRCLANYLPPDPSPQHQDNLNWEVDLPFSPRLYGEYLQYTEMSTAGVRTRPSAYDNRA